MRSSNSIVANAGTARSPATDDRAGGTPDPATPGTDRPDCLLTRVRSSLVLTAVAVVAVAAGGWLFVAAILVAAVIGMREWLSIVAASPPGRRGVIPVGAAGIGAVVAATGGLGVVPAVATAAAAGVALWRAARTAACGPAMRLWAAGGIAYLAPAAIAVVWLRTFDPGGALLIVYLVTVVAATDIGAYFVGRYAGGPRLAPDVSPQKTWSGLAGGLAAAGLTGGAIALAVGAAAPWAALGLGVGLGVIGQLGDLFESLVKRRHDVKDAGDLIPGHGGLLDRVDGLIAAAPAMALFHATLGWAIGW